MQSAGPYSRYPWADSNLPTPLSVSLSCSILKLYSHSSMPPSFLSELCAATSGRAVTLVDACTAAAGHVQHPCTRQLLLRGGQAARAALEAFQASAELLAATCQDEDGGGGDTNGDHNTHITTDTPSGGLTACHVFAESLVAACNSLVVFATQDGSLTGRPAHLTEPARDALHDLFSACMSIVSPCVLVCSLVRQVATDAERKPGAARVRVQQCQAVIMRASVQLSQTLGVPGYEM